MKIEIKVIVLVKEGKDCLEKLTRVVLWDNVIEKAFPKQRSGKNCIKSRKIGVMSIVMYSTVIFIDDS